MKLVSLVTFLYLFASQALAASDPTLEQSYTVKKTDSTVTFVTTATPGFLKITGKGGHVEGKLKVVEGVVSGNLWVPLKDFDTGIELRNKHMREKYLVVKDFPDATLTLLPFAHANVGTFKGILKIKKDSKPVEGTYKFEGGLVSAKLTINVKDFPSIGVPSYLGVTAADSVDITVGFALKK